MPNFGTFALPPRENVTSRHWRLTENLDNLVSRSILSWLDLPVSTTLTSLVQTKNQFGLNLKMSFVKFIQCPTVSRNILRSSLNFDVQALRKNASDGTNLQMTCIAIPKRCVKQSNPATKSAKHTFCHHKVPYFHSC